MEILINGKNVQAEERSLSALIARRGFQPERVVVEYNGEIIARAHWEETILKPGDRLEIVTFVGGG